MNVDEISVVSICPGYVATRIADYRYRDKVDECIEGIVKVVEGVGMSQTGTYINWRN